MEKTKKKKIIKVTIDFEKMRRLLSAPKSPPLEEDEPLATRLSNMLQILSKNHDPLTIKEHSYPIPVLSKRKIQTISEDVSSIHDCITRLQNTQNLFNFSTEFVAIASNVNSRAGLISNAIGWLLQPIDESYSDDFSILFSALVTSLFVEFTEEILFAFHLCFAYYIKSGYYVVPQKSFTQLCNIFLHSTKFCKNHISFLTLFLNDKNNYEETCVTISHLINQLQGPTDYDFTDMINRLLGIINKFSLNAIDLLLQISTHSQNVNISDAIIEFSHIVYEELKKITTNTKIEVPDSKIYSKVNFEPTPTDIISIPQLFEYITYNDLESHFKMEEFFTNEQLHLLGIIQPVMDCQKTIVPVTFLSELSILIMADDYKYSNEIFMFLCQLICSMNCDIVPTVVSNAIINSVQMNPHFSYFTVFDEKINFIRNSLFEGLIKKWPDLLKSIILQSENFPYLFAEHFIRFIGQKEQHKVESLIDKQFIGALVNVMNALIGLKGDYKAWFSVLIILVDLLKRKEILFLCFSIPEFVKSFMILCLNDHISQYVFTAFTDIMVLPERDENVINNIHSFYIFLLSNDDIQNEDYYIPMVKSLQQLISHVSYFTGLIDYFTDLESYILKIFFTSPSSEMLQCVLSFVSLTQVKHTGKVFNLENRVNFSHAIKEAEPNGASDKTIAFLISLMANNKTIGKDSMFVLQNEVILLLFLSITGTKSIPFFGDLCKFSSTNIRQLHKGELDLLILHTIKNYPNNFEFRGLSFVNNIEEKDINDKLYPILNFMAQNLSSKQVAYEYLSLAIPKKGSDYSKMSPLAINFLNIALAQCCHNHTPTLLFQSPTEYKQFLNIDTNEIKKGFTFSCWINIDFSIRFRLNIQPLIFSVADDASSSIILYMKGSSLIAQLSGPEIGPTSVTLSMNIPSSEWFFLSFMFSPKGDGSVHFLLSINGEQPSLVVCKDPNFTTPNCFIQIGGYCNSDAPKYSKNIICILADCHFQYGVLSQSQIVSLMNHGKVLDGTCPEVIPKLPQASNDFFRPIYDITNNYHFTSKIIPFFMLKDLSGNYIESVIDLMKRCGGLSTGRYKIVLHFLRQNNNLSYEIYLRFTDLLNEITNEKCRKALLKDIILNLELWMVCNQKNLQKIVDHWHQVLYVEDSSHEIWNVLSFSDVLNMMRLILWYRPDEKEFVLGTQGRKRAQDINVRNIRNALFKLLAMYPQNMWTKEDLDALVSHIVSCPDIDQVIDLLQLLPMFTTHKDATTAIDHLFTLINRPIPRIFCATVRSLLEFLPKQKLEISRRLLYHLTKDHCTIDMLSQLRAMPDEFAYTFNLLCYIAHYINNVDECVKTILILKEVAKDRTFCQRVSCCQAWYVWPILCAMRIPEDKQVESVVLIHSVYIENPNISLLDEIVAFLDILQIDNKDSSIFTFRFLHLLCNVDFIDWSMEAKIELIHRCSRFLFFSFKPNFYNNALIREMLNSPFNINDFFKPPSFQSFITDISSLLTVLKKAAKIPPLLFCVDLCDNGHALLYESLASAVLYVMQSIPAQNKTKTLLIIEELCDYMMNAKRTINTVEKYESIKKLMTNLVFFVNTMINSYPQVVYEKMSHLYRYLSTNVQGEAITKSPLSTVAFLKLHELTNTLKKYNHHNEIKAWKFCRKTINEISIWKDYIDREPERIDTSSNSLIQSDTKWWPPAPKFNEAEMPNNETDLLVKCKARRMKLSQVYSVAFSLNQTKFSITSRHKSKEYETSQISYLFIHTFANMAQPTGVEIILRSGRSYLIDFHPHKSSVIIKAFGKCNLMNCVYIHTATNFANAMSESQTFTARWLDFKLSNYEYLMFLNRVAGRSFNDYQKFPLLPRLTNPSSKIAMRNFITDPPVCPFTDKWLSFLKTSQPRLAISSNSEVFVSSETLRLSLSESASDNSLVSSEKSADFSCFVPDFDDFESALNSPVLELCPPFFGAGLWFNDLPLPTFAHGDPAKYVNINRILIESDDVSKRIHQWIDFVFGVNQCIKGIPQLFSVPHDQRVIREQPHSATISTNVNETLAATIILDNTSHVKIRAITKTHNIIMRINTDNGDVSYDIEERSNDSVFIIPTRKRFMDLDFIPDTYGYDENIVYGTRAEGAFIAFEKNSKKNNILNYFVCNVFNITREEIQSSGKCVVRRYYPILPYDTSFFVMDEKLCVMRAASKSNILAFIDNKKIIRHSVTLKESPISMIISRGLLTGVLTQSSFMIFDNTAQMIFSIEFKERNLFSKIIFDGDVFGLIGKSMLGYLPFNIETADLELRVFKFASEQQIQAGALWIANKCFYTFSAHGALNIIPLSLFTSFV